MADKQYAMVPTAGAVVPGQVLGQVMPAPQGITVQCPPGGQPGQQMQITLPNTGQVIAVQIPPGCPPGGQFQVQAPVITAQPAGPAPAQVQEHVHALPANLACWQSDAQNPTGDVASGRCPAEGTTVQCLLQAGWGQIAGNCDACDEAECSRKGLSGAESCAALACTDSPGFLGAGAGTKCQGNAWKDGPSPYDPAHADGYCDCAPDCADCDGPGPADGALGVTSSSCDARNGTAPASDWANCWNSCVDCMGDDLSHQGIAKYMPEAMGQQIVGTANWTTYNVGHYNGTGTWWLCKTDSPTQKGDCAWMGKADGLPMGPKFKGLALCA